MAKENLLYSKDHEWVRREGDAVVVGVTDYAQHELGDVVFVDLPAAGKALKKGDPVANIESVKAVSDVYSPVSGAVLAANARLSDNPELVNQDPFGEGWILRVKPSDPAEFGKLMSNVDYEKHVEEQHA
jgi:glycine cleavage system H protein